MTAVATRRVTGSPLGRERACRLSSLEPDVFVSDVGVITRGVLPARELHGEDGREGE